MALIWRRRIFLKSPVMPGGAIDVNPEVQTIVDIGGQDCKVIALNKKGRVLDFQMELECSAEQDDFLR